MLDIFTFIVEFLFFSVQAEREDRNKLEEQMALKLGDAENQVIIIPFYYLIWYNI